MTGQGDVDVNGREIAHSIKSQIRWTRRRRRDAKNSPWNSLEIVKLLVGALTPLMIACGGVYASWYVHQRDVERANAIETTTKKAASQPLIDELLSNSAGVVAGLGDLDDAIATKHGRQLQRAVDKLQDEIYARAHSADQASAKLGYLMNDRRLTEVLSNANMRRFMQVGEAVRCARSHLSGKAATCSIKASAQNMFECAGVLTVALTYSENWKERLARPDSLECFAVNAHSLKPERAASTVSLARNGN